MTEPERLIEKHRAGGLLIDANLLLLLFVGRTNPDRIAKFDRTHAYDISAYELLEKTVSMVRRTLTTPHVLTEVSNLARLAGTELETIRREMKECIEVMEELHEPSRIVVRDVVFSRLGLTDAAISTVCTNVLVLTNDHDLWDSLTRRGLDAINFAHLRASDWQLTS
jgi:rRNA-processing protein FCF1